MANDVLTPLAILGLAVFGVLVLLLVVLFVQQALGVTRLLRSGRVQIRFTRESPLEDATRLEPSPAPPRDAPEPAPDPARAKKGWGFD